MDVKRVLRRADFLAADRYARTSSGARIVTPAFILLVNRRDGAETQAETRVGFTVSKRLGNAVRRNRARRRLREMARQILPEHAIAGADHIFIARPLPEERDFEQLLDDARQSLRKAARKLQGQQ